MFKKYLLCLVILGLASSIWTVQNFDQPYPKPLGPHFDADMKTTYLREIRNQQPNIILLGDSTLDRGVDVPQLTESLGRSVYKLGIDGSASAVWYLALKNSILDSSHRPPYLVLFFRGTLLTRPADRVTGRYFSLLDELADDDEDLVMQLSYIQEMNPFQRFLDQYLPLYGDRTLLKDGVERTPRYSSTSRILNCNRDCTNLALASVFETPNLRPEAAQRALIDAEIGLYDSGNEDFSSQVEKSYLPEIIRLCKANGIQLIVVHTPTLVYPSRQAEPEFLRRYMQDLSTYLNAQDVTFLDFYFDPRISTDMYADAVHMNPKGRMAFTHILAEALKPILK